MKAFFGWYSIIFSVLSLLIYIVDKSPIQANYFMLVAVYFLILAKEWKG